MTPITLNEALCLIETGLDPRLRVDLFNRLRDSLRPDVLGKISIDPVGEILETGYQQFDSPTGVYGLAKANGDRLDILAIQAKAPGRGQFRDFMHLAKICYPAIYVWETWSHALANTLHRYGFAQVSERDPHTGEIVEGWCWTQPFHQKIK